MITLSVESITAAYDYLRTFDPFLSWNLPEPEEIRFRVVKGRKIWGQIKENDPIRIDISSAHIGRHETLLTTMAHEMIHLHQILTGMDIDHGEAFQRLADEVCAVHDFDRKVF